MMFPHVPNSRSPKDPCSQRRTVKEMKGHSDHHLFPRLLKRNYIYKGKSPRIRSGRQVIRQEQVSYILGRPTVSICVDLPPLTEISKRKESAEPKYDFDMSDHKYIQGFCL